MRLRSSTGVTRVTKRDKKYEDLESQVQQVCAESGIVTSWLLIAEVMSPDGVWGINVIHDTNSPSWRYESMIHMAHDIVEEGVSVAEDGDEDLGN
jgi:hypothetical protein